MKPCFAPFILRYEFPVMIAWMSSPIARGLLLAIVSLLASCMLRAPPPGIGEAVSWESLSGWRDDHHAEAWPALLASCKAMPTRDVRWKDICADADQLADPDDAAARAFFEAHFTPHIVRGEASAADGLVTGYYEPMLYGSRTRSARFRYPVYARPDDLLVVDLGEVYPELKGKRLRGRLDGKRVVPYYSRAQIENKYGNGNGQGILAQPIVWVDDPVALFFLQVQGSGRVQLPDGQMVFLGYVDQNGHPFRAVGRRLVERGALKLEEITMQSVRDWLAAHPKEIESVLNSNPSYVFFTERDGELPGPLGALNVPLTPERAIAVDPSFVPLGAPVWLDTALPDEAHTPYRRLVLAQDTGGAIKGPVRADLFFGFGARAEDIAGHMKQPGRMHVLLPAARVDIATTTAR